MSGGITVLGAPAVAVLSLVNQMESDGNKTCFITNLKVAWNHFLQKFSKKGGQAKNPQESRELSPVLDEGLKETGRAMSQSIGRISQNRLHAMDGDRSGHLGKLRAAARHEVEVDGRDAWFGKEVVGLAASGPARARADVQARAQARMGTRVTEARLTNTRLRALAEALEPPQEKNEE